MEGAYNRGSSAAAEICKPSTRKSLKTTQKWRPLAVVLKRGRKVLELSRQRAAEG